MRKIKLAMYVSLDGVIENPAWTAPFWNEEISDMQEQYLHSSDALLLGYDNWRTTTPSSGRPPGSAAAAAASR